MGRGTEGAGGNILFAPPRKKRQSVYDLKGRAQKKKSQEIAQEIRDGSFDTLLFRIEKKRGALEDYPVFLDAFSEFSKAGIDDIILAQQLPRRAKGLAKERREIEEGVGIVLAQRSAGIAQDARIPLDDKKELLTSVLTIDYELLARVILQGDGPLADTIKERLSLVPLQKDLTREEIDFLLNDSKGKEAWESMMRREIFQFIHKASPDSFFPKQLRYGVMRGFQSGGVMHILSESGRTLCSNNADPMHARRGTSHGDWHDANALRKRRQCAKCRKKADPDLLDKINTERGDDQSEYFGQNAQGMVEALAAREDIKNKARDAFRQGKSAEEISSLLRHEMLDDVSEIMLEASYDNDALLEYAGGGHVLWSALDNKVIDVLHEAGYPTPGQAFNRINRRYYNKKRAGDFDDALLREDDLLPSIVQDKFTKKYLKELLRATLAEDLIEGNNIRRKARRDAARVIVPALERSRNTSKGIA